MTNNPVADLSDVRQKIARIIAEDWSFFAGVGQSELGTADRILAALTPASAEPVAWRYDDLKVDNFDRPVFFTKRRSGVYLDTEEFSETPLYTHPAPMTVEAAAKVLLDFDGFHRSTAWAKAIQAYTLRNGKVRPVALYEAWIAALSALSGEKS